MSEVIALIACAMAVFYYLSWRKAAQDVNAMLDAIHKVATGRATIELHGDTATIKDNDA